MLSIFNALTLSAKSPLTGLNKHLQQYCQGWQSSTSRMPAAGTQARGLYIREPAQSLWGDTRVCMEDVKGMPGGEPACLSLQPILPIRLATVWCPPTTKWPQAQGSTASSVYILLEMAPPGRQQQRQERRVRNSQEASCPSLSVLLKTQEH